MSLAPVLASGATSTSICKAYFKHCDKLMEGMLESLQCAGDYNPSQADLTKLLSSLLFCRVPPSHLAFNL